VGVSNNYFAGLMVQMVSKSDLVERMVNASFLNETTKRSYWQAYQGRLKQLTKE